MNSTLLAATLSALTIVGALSGCEIVGGYKEFSPRSAQGTDGGSSDGALPSRACEGADLQDIKGARMKRMEYGASCFWMDETEVSRLEYRQFLDADGGPGPVEEAACAGNVYEPPEGGDAGEPCPGGVVITAADDHPIVCVDWCDAAAYCAWAGKALCRGEPEGAALVSRDDWYAACSNGGASDYPSEHQSAEACNSSENRVTGCNTQGGRCTTVPVAALSECRNEAGVLNLTGNVAEWTAGCGTSGDCHVRGGSMQTPKSSSECAGFVPMLRTERRPSIGFRCCHYPS